MKQQYQFDISPKNKCGIIIFRVDPRRVIDLYITGTCIANNADCNQAQLISHVLHEILEYTESKKCWYDTKDQISMTIADLSNID